MSCMPFCLYSEERISDQYQFEVISPHTPAISGVAHSVAVQLFGICVLATSLQPLHEAVKSAGCRPLFEFCQVAKYRLCVQQMLPVACAKHMLEKETFSATVFAATAAAYAAGGTCRLTNQDSYPLDRSLHLC